MDLANYLNISLKPILTNNFDSNIETGGGNNIGQSSNGDSQIPLLNLTQLDIQQTSVIKEEDEHDFDENTGTPVRSNFKNIKLPSKVKI
jgi:hypothetical protein